LLPHVHSHRACQCFLRSQAQAILALDFFTVDLLNGAKAYVLAVIEHGSRRIRVLGATEHPVQSWVVQQARNLLMDLDDASIRVRFVVHDRDASFSAASGASPGPQESQSSARQCKRRD